MTCPMCNERRIAQRLKRLAVTERRQRRASLPLLRLFDLYERK